MAQDFKVVDADLEHAVTMAPHIREADLREIRALCGPDADPLQELIRGILQSDVIKAALLDGEPVAIFGVARIDDIAGAIWMLGTDGLLNMPGIFARRSRKWVNSLQEPYPILTNVVHWKNVVHHRWLWWCGFDFIRVHRDFGIGKDTFIEFARYR